jgi:hypothetical protein
MPRTPLRICLYSKTLRNNRSLCSRVSKTLRNDRSLCSRGFKTLRKTKGLCSRVLMPYPFVCWDIVHASRGGSRPDIKHKYYVPLHINLLVIYIIRMKMRLAVPPPLRAWLHPIEQPTPHPTKQKARTLEDILYEFGPITGVSFQPFQPEPPQIARALLLTFFPPKPHPIDYFSLFFTRDLF